MRKFTLAFLVALASCGPTLAAAQQLRQMTRSTSTTGLNDSALTLISDSAARTRAGSVAQLRKALSVKAFDSLVTTKFNLTGATITGAATWGSQQTFAANQRVDSATGAARAQTLTTARNLWGQSFNGSAAVTGSLTSVGSITGGASNMTITAGTGNDRSLTLAGTYSDGSNINWAVFGGGGSSTDSIITFNGQTTHVGGVKTITIVGGASDMTITAGVGASRAINLKTTNSASTPVNTLVLGGDSTATFLGRAVHSNGTAAAPSFNFTNSTGTGLYRFGADTIGIAVGGANAFQIPAVGKLVGNAGSMTITAGTGNSRTMTLQTTTSAGVVKNSVVLGADSSVTALGQVLGEDGSASVPSYSFTNDPNTGLFGPGSDTLVVATGGARSLQIVGGSSPKLIGSSSGSMTIMAGIGSSRTLTMQTTTAANNAKNTLVLGADSSATFLGAIVPNQTLGITGTTTNNAAVAGAYGETQSHTTAANTNSLTTNTPANVDSLTLTAGDWEVGGVVSFTGSATTSITMLAGGTNTTSATIGALGTYVRLENAAEVPGVTTDIVLAIPTVQVLIASSTKVYLVVNQTFTASTLKSGGVLRARRVR